MKLLCAGFALLVVLLLGALYHQHHIAAALRAELVALNRDRESTQAELRRLGRQLADLKARPAITTAASERARPANVRGSASTRITYAETRTPVQPQSRPGVTVGAPFGWGKNGAKPEFYAVGVDSNETWGGMPSAYVESLAPTVQSGFGGMMQSTARKTTPASACASAAG